MNEYLESLKKKDEEETEDISTEAETTEVNEVLEEVAEATEAISAAETEELNNSESTSKEIDTAEDMQLHEVIETVEDIEMDKDGSGAASQSDKADATVTITTAAKDVDVIKKEISESNLSVPDQKLHSKYVLEQVVQVVSKRIYNVPDTRTVSNLFSGNVIYKKEVNDMILVEYVKPGIGLVRGYLTSLD